MSWIDEAIKSVKLISSCAISLLVPLFEEPAGLVRTSLQDTGPAVQVRY
jgi:hypothetical protein